MSNAAYENLSALANQMKLGDNVTKPDGSVDSVRLEKLISDIGGCLAALNARLSVLEGKTEAPEQHK